MRGIRRSRKIAALALALGACRAAGERAPEPEAQGSAQGAPSAPAEAPNRDPHGQRDVAEYIATLESAERVEELRVAVVVEKLALPSNAWVGDVGCGPGVLALPLARAVREGLVFAADVEPRQLDRLSEHLAAQGVENVVPVLASFEDPHLPPGRLDLVLIADTLHHIRERVPYLQRLKEALRPGGRLAILELKPGPLPIGPPPEHKLAPGELERTLEDAGWTLVERFETHPYHDFELWAPARP
jgi:SAM-dependent methyltransferase